MDGHRGFPIAGIVERIDVAFCVRGQHQRLFHRVREEYDAIQFRMRGDQRGIIHRLRLLDNGGGITGNIVHGFRFGYRNIAGVFLGIQDIPDRIARGLCFRRVFERDDVVGIIVGQADGRAGCLRTITGHRDRRLGDTLSNGIVRVGHHLIGRNRLTPLIHIMDRIAQVVPDPVGIDRGVLCNLGSPVKQSRSRRRSIPAVKGITLFRGARIERLDSFILLNRLIRDPQRRPVCVHESDGISGSLPLGIENQCRFTICISGRHPVEGVFCCQP